MGRHREGMGRHGEGRMGRDVDGRMGRDEDGRMGRDEGGRVGRDGGEMEWSGVKEGGGVEPLTWARRCPCPFMHAHSRS